MSRFAAGHGLEWSAARDPNDGVQHHPASPPPPGDPVPRFLRHWLQHQRACFTAPSWEHVLVLVMGAVLAQGKRTVSACLRLKGRKRYDR